MGPIGLAVLTFIGYKQTDTPNLYIDYQQAIKHGGKINSIILICIREHIVGTEVEGDWVDGLVVALDFLRRESEGKKYTTLKIVLFRNILTSVYIIPVMLNLNYVEFSIIYCNSLKKTLLNVYSFYLSENW